MDHTFSSTGAIRHHHQQNVRNTLSSSPHNSLYRISPTSNIIAAASSPFSKSNPTARSFVAATGYSTSPQQTILSSSPTPGSVSSFFRIPPPPASLTVSGGPQQSYTFGSTSPVPGIPADNPYLSGGIHSNVGITQFPPPRPPPYNSAASRQSSAVNQSFSNPISGSSSNNFSNSSIIENSFQNKQQNHYQFVSNLGNNNSSSQSQSISQMHSNHQNLNKNRFANPVQQQNSNHPGSSSINVSMDSGCTAASSVKSLIQHISQSQTQSPASPQQQSNVNHNVVAASSSPSTPPQVHQGQPQYRIFKRGDSIPGISGPVQITINNSDKGDSNSSNANLTSTDNSDSNNANTSGGGDLIGSIDAAANNGSEEGVRNGGTTISSATSANGASRTPLSQIAEIARFHSLTVEYRLVKETGPPHAPTFTVVLSLGSEEFTGQGSSIKKAQYAAAKEALEKTSMQRPPTRSKPKKPFVPGGNKRPNWAIIQLTAVAQELQLPLQFVQQPVPIVDPFRRGEPPSTVCVHVGDRVFTGEGANFNSAKNMAVMIALKAMLKVKQELDLAKLQADADEQCLDAENKSPISVVHEMAMKRGLSVAFEIVQESGPPHMKVFTVKCKVGEDLETEGQGPTKQAAKKASSELMIAKLKEIPIVIPMTSQTVNMKAMQRGLFRAKAPKKKSSTPVVKDLEKQIVSPISRLIQIAHIKKFKEPEFTLISTGTENNVENFLKQITERDRRMLRKKKPVFTIEVSLGPHTCRGTGTNKKAAKKAAAEATIIALGYGPTDESLEDAADGTSALLSGTATGGGQSTDLSGGGGGNKHPPSLGKSGANEEKLNNLNLKVSGGRQIVPGIIVLKNDAANSSGGTSTADVAEEMKKVNLTTSPAVSSREGIDKLAYLSRLLEITVSYSDFPKKNEYLSVVSLTTSPPHVAHGCGSTLEEAQNAAALKILEELSTMGLDNVTAAADKSSE